MYTDFQKDVYAGRLTSKCWHGFLYNCELQNWGKYKICVTLKYFENVIAEIFLCCSRAYSCFKMEFLRSVKILGFSVNFIFSGFVLGKDALLDFVLEGVDVF